MKKSKIFVVPAFVGSNLEVRFLFLSVLTVVSTSVFEFFTDHMTYSVHIFVYNFIWGALFVTLTSDIDP